MTLYHNTDVHRRSWPSLSDEKGRTLELDPGEEVELEADVVDRYLKPAPLVPKYKPVEPKPVPPVEKLDDEPESPAPHGGQ